MPNALVTGAAGGIGLELCSQLAARGTRVVAACRSPGQFLPQLEGVRVEAGLDLATDEGIEQLASRLAGTALDLVILNAGLLERDGLDDLDRAAAARIRAQFEINALSPLRLAALLLPNLAPGAKLALITSRMGSIADNGSGGYYGYRMSKAALNAAAKSLAIDLAPRGITVVLLHPGFVRTRMTGGRGDIEASEAAARLLARIDEASPATSGAFVHADGTPLPW
jgi:NAD(P)-dependent dehydrogenase (short-subunit alcohol dehydrogenase family)